MAGFVEEFTPYYNMHLMTDSLNRLFHWRKNTGQKESCVRAILSAFVRVCARVLHGCVCVRVRVHGCVRAITCTLACVRGFVFVRCNLSTNVV